MFSKLTRFIILPLFFVVVGGALAQSGCNGSGTLVCSSPVFDGIKLGNSGDNLTINAGIRVENPVGAGVDALGGDDVVTNNGTIAALVWGIHGRAGNDRIINNGLITDGQTGVHGGAGSDTLENNGSIFASVTGVLLTERRETDTLINNGVINGLGREGAVVNGSVTNRGQISGGRHGVIAQDTTNYGRIDGIGGDGVRGTENRGDTIINHADGLIVGAAYSINGLSGNDQIINYGDLVGSIQGWSGNDTVTLYGGEISDWIIGGADYDTLIFAIPVPADQIEWLSAELAAADPLRGELWVNGLRYQWQYFEVLEARFTAQ